MLKRVVVNWWSRVPTNLTWLLAGISVSAFGSQMTTVVVPLFAVNSLNATTNEMAFLQASMTLPYLLFGLSVGHWLERISLRKVMIIADLLRCLIVCGLAVLFAVKSIDIWTLCLGVFLAATCTLFFDNAYYSIVPRVIDPDQTVEANSGLETGRQVASISGAGIAGFIIEATGAALALLIDAITYLISALAIRRLPEQMTGLQKTEAKVGLVANIKRGFMIVCADKCLWYLMTYGGAWNFFLNGWAAMFVLYASRILNLSTAEIAFSFAVQSAGLVVGASTLPFVLRHLKFGWAIWFGYFLAALGYIVVAVSSGSFSFGFVLFGTFAGAAASMQSGIAQLSLRQTIVSAGELPLVNATMRFVFWGMLPLGALAGGLGAQFLGLRGWMIFAALGMLTTGFLTVLSPAAKLSSLEFAKSRS
jgi:MFS family permease